MPTYQYACTACGHQLEAVQSFTDPALTQCPVCDGRLRKLFSAVGIVFKGSGFYRTDSRSGSTAESGGAKDAKDGAPKETKTTEAKPSTDSSSSTPASTSSSSSSSSSANGSSGGSSSGSSSGAKAATTT